MGGSNTTLSIVLKLVDDASSAMQSVASKMQSAGESMMSQGTNLMTHVTLPIVGAAIAVTKLGMDFQSAMTKLVTQAGLPKEALKGLTDQVLAFAQSGAQQTPEVLAEGLYHIVSLGVPAVHAMDVLKLASEGAAVSGANLEDVANALGAAVASNIKGSDDYQKSMAILNATVGAGNMRMQDLATSLGNVLPQATTAGLSLTDIGAAMATMTDNGMPAADAATRLHMAIALMQAPTGQATKALKEIGITQLQLADDMRNKGLLAALQDLHDHLNGVEPAREVLVKGTKMSAAAMDALTEKIANAKTQLNILETEHVKVGESTEKHQLAITKLTDSISQMETKLGSANSTLKTVGGTMLTANQQAQVLSEAFGGGRTAGSIELLLNNLDRVGQKYQLIGAGIKNFNSDVQQQGETTEAYFNRMKATAEAAGIEISNALLPLEAVIFPKIAAAISVVTDWFTHLSTPMKNAAITIAAVAAAAGPLEFVLGAIISAVGFLLSPFGLLLIAVTAAILLFERFHTQLAAFFSNLNAQTGIVTFFRQAWEQISSQFTKELLPALIQLWDSLKPLEPFLKALGIVIGATLLGALVLFTDALKIAISYFTDILTVATKIATFFTTVFAAAINFVIDRLSALFRNPAFSVVASVVGGTAHAIGGAVSGVMHAIPGFANGGIVNGPTLAMVGEAGPEAIIPLSAFQGGTGLARGGIGGLGGGVTVNINGGYYMDQQASRQFADMIAKTLNQQLRLRSM